MKPRRRDLPFIFLCLYFVEVVPHPTQQNLEWYQHTVHERFGCSHQFKNKAILMCWSDWICEPWILFEKMSHVLQPGDSCSSTRCFILPSQTLHFSTRGPVNPKVCSINPKSCWWFCFDIAFYIYNWMFPRYPFMDLKRMWLYVFRHVSCLLPKSWEEKSCTVL